MLYVQQQQRVIFCSNPWIRLKSRFSADQAVFWLTVAGGIFALLMPWGGQ